MEEEEIGKPISKKTVAKTYDDGFKVDPRVEVYLKEKNKTNPNNIKIESFNTSGNKDYLQGWENPHTIYGGIGDTNSNDPFSELRANNQSSLNKFIKLSPRISTKIISEIAKIPGYIGGLGGGLYGEASDAITGKNEYSFTEQAFNNSWIKGVTELNEKVNNEALPVYVKKSVKEGNLWDNISSVDFWATEGADGIGFMASMLVPGAVLKGLGLGSKLARSSEVIASIGSKGTKFQKLMQGAQKASKLGLTVENFDMIAATTANTYLEAAAESGMAMDSFEKENKNEFIDNALASGKTMEQAEQEFNTQKAILGKNMFVSNVALLTIPNTIQSSIMFGKGASKFMSKYGTKEFLKNSGKRMVGSTLSEGFVEEASQTTVENYFKEKAKKNNLKGDGLFSFDDFDPKGLKEAYLDTISSVDGQKAIFLGGLLGSSMSVIQGRKEDIRNKKQSDEAVSLTQRYDQTLQALTDPSGNVSYNYNNQRSVSKKEIIEKFRTIDALSNRFDEYDEALASGNEEQLEKVRNKTIQDVILPFVKNGEIGIEALTQYYDKMLESDEVKNSEDFDLIQSRKEEVIKTAQDVSKKYDFYTNFINKRFNIPIKAANKEEQKTLDLLKAQYFNKLSSSYALAEMEKEQVKNKLKSVNKELDELNKIHNLNEVTTDELINEYVHNTDTTESFINKKKDNFASKNESYKKLLDYKNKLEEKLKETNIEISENYFDNKKINNDFLLKEEDNIENTSEIEINEVLDDEMPPDELMAAFSPKKTTEDEQIDKALEVNEVAQVEKELQSAINESIDENGQPTFTQEDLGEFLKDQDIPEEVKDAIVLLNEKQINTLPTQEEVEDKSDFKLSELEGVNEEDLAKDDSIQKEEDKDISNSFINIEVITPKENKTLGHKIQNFFSDVFKKFEKEPRDKTNDDVSFSLGDLKYITGQPTILAIFTKLKNGTLLIPSEVEFLKENQEWLENYLPIQVTLSNGKEKASSFLKAKTNNVSESTIFNNNELPLRKAIIKALLDNKGDFTKFKGSVQGQGKGKLNLDNNSTNNNVLKLSVFNNMTNEQKIKYIKENSYIVNHAKQLVNTNTGQIAVDSFFNVIKSFHSGDLFLVVTRPNGEKVPIKLNNKRVTRDKAKSTVQLFALLSKTIKNNEGENILSDKDFFEFIKKNIGIKAFETLNSEIILSKRANNITRLREIIEYVTFSQNNNPITKLFIDNSGNLTLGSLIQKVNEDLQENGSIDYETNLSSIGFVGFQNNNIDALINDESELDTNESIRLNHLVNFIMYKKTNIKADKLNDDTYIQHVFDIGNNDNSSGNALVSTNVAINQDMFEGYSDIYLNNDVINLENNKAVSKEETEINNTEIPLSKEVVYNEPQSNIEAKKADIEKERQDDLKHNTDIPEGSYVTGTNSAKNALIKFRTYLTDVLGWEKMSISYNNKELVLDYLNQELRIPAEILILGGGNAILTIDVKDVINAKYDAELAALEKIENNSENTRIIQENFVSLSNIDNITNLKDKVKIIKFAKDNLDFKPKSMNALEQFKQLKEEFNSEKLNEVVNKVCNT